MAGRLTAQRFRPSQAVRRGRLEPLNQAILSRRAAVLEHLAVQAAFVPNRLR